MTRAMINVSSSFRYVRYVGPANSACNVAEIRLIGYSSTVPTPTGLIAMPGIGEVSLKWNAAPGGVTNYLIKRSAVSGGPYTTVGSSSGTSYTDMGLVNGVVYYYVLEATSPGGLGGVSAEVETVPGSTLVPYDTVLPLFGPSGYWRLNETDGTNAADASGHGLNGVYESGASVGVPGPNPPFSGFSTTDSAASFAGAANACVSLPPLNLSSANVTFTAWIFPTVSAQNKATGLIFNRVSTGSSGFCFADSGTQLSYVWNDDSGTWNYQSGLVPPVNMWSFIALVITPTNASFYLCNGDGNSTNTFVHKHLPAAFGGETRIGGDSMADGVRYFQGKIAQVAVFGSSLSALQIYQIFNTGNIGEQVGPIVIKTKPGNVQLSWIQGTLVESTNLTGPWVTNGSSGSTFTAPVVGTQRFYRLKLP